METARESKYKEVPEETNKCGDIDEEDSERKKKLSQGNNGRKESGECVFVRGVARGESATKTPNTSSFGGCSSFRLIPVGVVCCC